MTWMDAVWLVLGTVLFAAFISLTVMALTYIERKFIGRLQARLGPTRTGPFGLLQPFADSLKLILKEDFTPASADKVAFWIAPLVVFVPAFVVWVTIPFTRDLAIRNLDMGILFIIAVSGLSIVGMLMGGWGSYNKYGMLGAGRSAAQLISYEIPLLVGVLGVVMIAQSMNLRDIVGGQGVWYIVLQPLGFVLVFASGLAEVGRAPFDIPFAESEVIGGPFIEYSGMHWAMFYFAEYANTFFLSALVTLLFLGGWRGPGPASGWGEDVMMAFWFFAKTMLMVLVIFWIRSAIPRFRIDQLMSLAWKVLIPLSFVNLLLTAIYLFYGWPDWTISVMSLAILAGVWYIVGRRRRAGYVRPTTQTVPARAKGVVG